MLSPTLAALAAPIAFAMAIPVAALAQTATPAAAPSADAPLANSHAEIDAQIQNYLDSASGPDDQAGPGQPGRSTGEPDRSVHGEFGVGIGSNGYRHLDASVEGPLGNIGSAAIAVSQTDTDGRWAPKKQQSVAVAVNLGDSANRAWAGPCDPRAVQPLWVQRLRDSQGETGPLCAGSTPAPPPP